MNREQAKRLLPIIQAFAEGKEIQARLELGSGWHTITDPTLAPWIEWRVKPEKKKVWLYFDKGTDRLCTATTYRWAPRSALALAKLDEIEIEVELP